MVQFEVDYHDNSNSIAWRSFKNDPVKPRHGLLRSQRIEETLILFLVSMRNLYRLIINCKLINVEAHTYDRCVASDHHPPERTDWHEGRTQQLSRSCPGFLSHTQLVENWRKDYTRAHRSTSACLRSHTQPAQSNCSGTCVPCALHSAVVHAPVRKDMRSWWSH
jgi:hypothetical protein